MDSENTAFEFRTKRILAFGVDCETLDQIHKFPFPIQQLIVSEVHAVEKRIEKEKLVPGARTKLRLGGPTMSARSIVHR